jgi:hypothetical protein
MPLDEATIGVESGKMCLRPANAPPKTAIDDLWGLFCPPRGVHLICGRVENDMLVRVLVLWLGERPAEGTEELGRIIQTSRYVVVGDLPFLARAPSPGDKDCERARAQSAVRKGRRSGCYRLDSGDVGVVLSLGAKGARYYVSEVPGGVSLALDVAAVDDAT